MWISRKEKRRLQHKLWNERMVRVGYQELAEKLEAEAIRNDEIRRELMEALDKAEKAFRELQEENARLKREIETMTRRTEE